MLASVVPRELLQESTRFSKLTIAFAPAALSPLKSALCSLRCEIGLYTSTIVAAEEYNIANDRLSVLSEPIRKVNMVNVAIKKTPIIRN